jgi:SET domain-containing protein
MLRIKTKLGISKIDGIGLFADQLIPRDTVVWEYNPLIDLKLKEDEIATLAEGARQQVQKYSYRDELTGLYIFCGDDARFFNHSDEPNCVDVTWGPFGGRTIATRDIQVGEELTCNYASFDMDLMEGKYRLPERQETRYGMLSRRVNGRVASKH